MLKMTEKSNKLELELGLEPLEILIFLRKRPSFWLTINLFQK